MKITIIYPQSGHTAYKIAAEAFAELAEKVDAAKCTLISDHEPLPENTSPVVVIGTDSVNHLAAELYLAREIDHFGIRYNTDDYRIYSKEIDGRVYLFLAGGRPRSTLYAVYRYFEKFCGCRWFWDGDRIPEAELPVSEIDLTESPRFSYRGLRYFAHRSLHRFQAEHWSLADWQREIDWIVKKRLNLFMLRIGLDDLFQKAFPDIVPYPKFGETMPAGEASYSDTIPGYNDRNLFWSLEFRGELRKSLLKYAFERDLMHPEDCGTMTHWYSTTPKAFLDAVKPSLLTDSHTPTNTVWNVLDNRNLENYFKLTETHIREYGRQELFHTIGLGERSYSSDREVNLRLKLYVYRRISAYLKEKYTNAPLLIASWDLWMFYTKEEMARLLSELDPEQAIIFDYTSDTKSHRNFTEWGVVGKFPWVFGMFSGYEADSDIRGFYDFTNERIRIAKSDPMCKGVILWPELSHGDTFMTEYLARNAWETDTPSVDELVDSYCRDRYPAEDFPAMHKIWQDFMPIVQMVSWCPADSVIMHWGQNLFTYLKDRVRFTERPFPFIGRNPEDGAAHQGEAVRVLRLLAEIEPTDEMLRRDIFDIARTVLGRYTDCAVRLAEVCWLEKDVRFYDAMDAALGLMEALRDLLASHEDYSLLKTLEGMQKVSSVNPSFEATLKQNAANGYCRSFISENAAYLYLPEMEIIFDEAKKSYAAGTSIDREAINTRIAENMRKYFEIPLSHMICCSPNTMPELLRNAADILEKIPFDLSR